MMFDRYFSDVYFDNVKELLREQRTARGEEDRLLLQLVPVM